MGIPLQVASETTKQGVTLSINNKDLYAVVNLIQARLNIGSQGLVMASILAEFLEASPLLAMAKDRQGAPLPLAWTVEMTDGLKSIKTVPIGDMGTMITMLEKRREEIGKAIKHIKLVIDGKITEAKGK